jgi:hypothetical protein
LRGEALQRVDAKPLRRRHGGIFQHSQNDPVEQGFFCVKPLYLDRWLQFIQLNGDFSEIA